MNNEVNKFCSKCNSPNVTDKWGDGKYYCLFCQPTKISETTFQEQPFYEPAKEINFLIEFYKNLSWILDSAENDKDYEMEIIKDEDWGSIQIIREEVLEKITKKIKKLAKEVEERPN